MPKKLFCLSLTFALILSLVSCGSKTPAPVVGEEDTVYTSQGYTLSVPNEYTDLLLIDTTVTEGRGSMFFSVREKASVEACKKLHGNDLGGGFLFGIGTLNEEEFQLAQCGDMSNSEVFAKDDNGLYYMYYHPSDVQLIREGDPTDADWALWTELCEWAVGAPDRFMADNPGLTSLRRTNTSLDICLNRLLYWEDVAFTLTHSSMSAAIFPTHEQSLPHLERLTACQVSDADGATTPEGAYITLHIPDENARFDFFLDGSGLFREFFFDGSSALYRIDCDSGIPAGQIALDWYSAAANV